MDFVLLSKQKPAEGAPCNGCGECCQAEACFLSVELLKSSATPCIALEFDGAAYRCGLVARPGHYLGTPEFGDGALAEVIAGSLGIGTGCDSNTRAVTEPLGEIAGGDRDDVA